MYKKLAIPPAPPLDAALKEVGDAVRSGAQFAGKDIVMLIGDTGAGKSLLMSALLGYPIEPRMWCGNQLYALEDWKALPQESKKGTQKKYVTTVPGAPVIGHKKVSETNALHGLALENLVLVDTPGFFDTLDRVGALGIHVAFRTAKSVRIVLCCNYTLQLSDPKASGFSRTVENIANTLFSGDVGQLEKQVSQSFLTVISHIEGEDFDAVEAKISVLAKETKRRDLAFIARKASLEHAYLLPFSPDKPETFDLIRSQILALEPMAFDRTRSEIPLPADVIAKIESALAHPFYLQWIGKGVASQHGLKMASEALDMCQEAYHAKRKVYFEIADQLQAIENQLPKGVFGNDLPAIIQEKRQEKEAWSAQPLRPSKLPEDVVEKRLYRAYLDEYLQESARVQTHLEAVILELEKSYFLWKNLQQRQIETCTSKTTAGLALKQAEIALQQAKNDDKAVAEKIKVHIHPIWIFLRHTPTFVEGLSPQSSIRCLLATCNEYGMHRFEEPVLSVWEIIRTKVLSTPCKPVLDRVRYLTDLDKLGLGVSDNLYTGVISLVTCLAQIVTKQFTEIPLLHAQQMLEEPPKKGTLQFLFNQAVSELGTPSPPWGSLADLRETVLAFQIKWQVSLPPLALVDELRGTLEPITDMNEEAKTLVLTKSPANLFQLIVFQKDLCDTLETQVNRLCRTMEVEDEYTHMLTHWNMQGWLDLNPLQKFLDQLTTLSSIQELITFSGIPQTCSGIYRLCELEPQLVNPLHAQVVDRVKRGVKTRLEEIGIEKMIEISRKLAEEKAHYEAALADQNAKVESNRSFVESLEKELSELEAEMKLGAQNNMVKLKHELWSHLDRKSYLYWAELAELKAETTLARLLSCLKIKIRDSLSPDQERYLLREIKARLIRMSVAPVMKPINQTVMVISSDFLLMSTVLNEVRTEKSRFEHSHKEARLTLKLEVSVLILDVDLSWNEHHLEIEATKVVVPKKVTIDTSACAVIPPNFKPWAKPEIRDGLPGEKGADGLRGRDAGNIRITIREELDDPNNFLSLKSNGSDGTPGQPGAPGHDGAHGIDGDSGKINDVLAELSFAEGCRKFFAYKWAYKDGGKPCAVEGQPGGRGGDNGVGGHRGLKGTVRITIQGIERHTVNVEAKDGELGKDGSPGEGGEGGLLGMKGMDVGQERLLLYSIDDKLGELEIRDESGWMISKRIVTKKEASVWDKQQRKARGELASKGDSGRKRAKSQAHHHRHTVKQHQAGELAHTSESEEREENDYAQRRHALLDQLTRVKSQLTEDKKLRESILHKQKETEESLKKVRANLTQVKKIQRTYANLHTTAQTVQQIRVVDPPVMPKQRAEAQPDRSLFSLGGFASSAVNIVSSGLSGVGNLLIKVPKAVTGLLNLNTASENLDPVALDFLGDLLNTLAAQHWDEALQNAYISEINHIVSSKAELSKGWEFLSLNVFSKIVQDGNEISKSTGLSTRNKVAVAQRLCQLRKMSASQFEKEINNTGAFWRNQGLHEKAYPIKKYVSQQTYDIYMYRFSGYSAEQLEPIHHFFELIHALDYVRNPDSEKLRMGYFKEYKPDLPHPSDSRPVNEVMEALPLKKFKMPMVNLLIQAAIAQEDCSKRLNSLLPTLKFSISEWESLRQTLFIELSGLKSSAHSVALQSLLQSTDFEIDRRWVAPYRQPLLALGYARISVVFELLCECPNLPIREQVEAYQLAESLIKKNPKIEPEPLRATLVAQLTKLPTNGEDITRNHLFKSCNDALDKGPFLIQILEGIHHLETDLTPDLIQKIRLILTHIPMAEEFLQSIEERLQVL